MHTARAFSSAGTAAATAAVAMLALVVSTMPIAAAAAEPPMRGFVYTSYASGGFSSNASTTSLLEVAATGVRVVEIMATYYVANSVNATKITPNPNSPTDADVVRAIHDAHAAGLAVALKPHIDSDDGVWRANIGTRFTSEAQWTDWFANYTSFLTHFAAIARDNGVVGFNVGTELDGTHARVAEWRAVIAAVRAILPPPVKLWLGPNWNWQGQPGYQLVKFWDALDLLGVDMYAPLAQHPDPTLAEAVAGWAPIIANLSAFSAANDNKGFVFAEIGYASFRDAAVNAPACCTGPPDLATQAILYSSFFAAVWPQPWMAGVFWWAWPENMPGGNPCGSDFSVFAKPAAAVVHAAYGGGAAAAAAVPASALSTAAPLMIYADGVTTWADYSYGGVKVDLKSTTDPYPAHVMSAACSIDSTGGAFALHSAANIDIAPFTVLSFDIRAPNTSNSYSLSAWLCACNDCSNCPVHLPTIDINGYAPPAAPCTVPSSWDADPAAARISIPLSALVPPPPEGQPPVTIARVQLGSSGTATDFAVDNIQFA